MSVFSNVEYIDLNNKDIFLLNELDDSTVVDAIQKKFDDFLNNDPMLSSVFTKLKEASIPAVIFGGWVRDQYLSCTRNVELSPRDIDIVVDLPKGISLESILSKDNKKTMFGGYVAKTTISSLDIWDIKNTYLINSLSLESSLTVLPSTTVFSINSIIFYPSQLHQKAKVLESGFIDAIDKGTISFKSSRVPFPTVQVARAVMYSAKCSFELHSDVKKFIHQVCISPYDVETIFEGINNYCPSKYKEKANHIFTQILKEAGLEYLPKTHFFNHCWGVFEGGGVRGAALAGAYKAAVSSGINFGRVAGTSAGSIVAALVASGATPEFILNQLEKKDFNDFMKTTLTKDNAFGSKSLWRHLTKPINGLPGELVDIWKNSGKYSSIEIQTWLDRILCEQLGIRPPVRFSDLTIPLYIVASDIAAGKPRLWSKEETPNESVAFAVRCSSSIPLYFQPVSDGTSLLVDGGMISNVPSWVFSTPEMQKKSSRILCFRLQDTTNSEITSLTGFIESLVSTVINGGTEIQLQMQNNTYAVNIPTGEYKATDFDRVDLEAKNWLIKSGFDSVKKFVRDERIAVRNRSENIIYKGFDEKLLLIVEYLNEATDEVLIVSSNSYWLYFVFPSVVFALDRGVNVNILLKPAKPDDKDEIYRQRLLKDIGAGLFSNEEIPFEGVLLDRFNERAIAAISTADGVVGRDYQYSEEKIRVYSNRSYDSPILNALNNQIEADIFENNKNVNITIESIPPEQVFEKLKEISQYKNSTFTLESVSLSDKLMTLDLHVKEYKLAQVALLASIFKKANIALFSPATFKTSLGVNSIITPPIIEKVGSEFVIIEGHTRFYYALKNNIHSIKAIIINGVTGILPAKPRAISMLNLVSDTLDKSELFDNFDNNQMRPIESVMHPVDDS
ncbi:patatin-like phospholipase family protein [Pseudoalteromonas sp. SCSIO 43210]